MGVDVEDGMRHTEHLRTAGFKGVRKAHLKGPIGPWAKGQREKEIGVLALKDLADNMVGISMTLFVCWPGHTPKAVEELCGRAKAELLNPRVSLVFQGPGWCAVR
jgi:hypothetical protein